MSEIRPESDVRRIAARVDALELTLLDVVTALGMLVGELALRTDLALSKPEVVEEALERGWQTLFGAAAEAELNPPPEWADPARLQEIAPDALAAAMDETGAAVGAVYAIDRGVASLVSSAGYPPGLMEQFATIPLDADFPVCTVARSGSPLWFSQRTEIVDRYPHLREAHRQTEEALGTAETQGAVVPLETNGDVAAVVIVGFAVDAGSPSADRLRAVRESIVAAVTRRRGP